MSCLTPFPGVLCHSRVATGAPVSMKACEIGDELCNGVAIFESPLNIRLMVCLVDIAIIHDNKSMEGSLQRIVIECEEDLNHQLWSCMIDGCLVVGCIIYSGVSSDSPLLEEGEVAHLYFCLADDASLPR